MAIYGESLTVQYVAWDMVNHTPKTGDVSNHTIRWVKDGVATTPTNTPSEVDATNAPGIYTLTLTATETQCWVGTLCGKSATSGVVIMPVTIVFDTFINSSGVVVASTANTEYKFKTNLSGDYATYRGTYLIFTSGSNRGVAREVIDFDASQFVEVSVPFPSVPSADDTFILVGYSGR